VFFACSNDLLIIFAYYCGVALLADVRFHCGFAPDTEISCLVWTLAASFFGISTRPLPGATAV